MKIAMMEEVEITQQMIDIALNELLGALEDAERYSRKQPDTVICMTAAAEPFAQIEAYYFLHTPVLNSIEKGLRTVGKILHRRGGTKAMFDTLERVSSFDPMNRSWRERKINAVWDGVGSEDDVWAS